MSSFFTNFTNVFSKDTVSDTGFYICYLVEITIMITLFESFCSITANFVTLLLEFMGAILPTYFLAVGIMGQASAVGFYQLTLVISGICQFVFLKIAIPLIKTYLAIALVNNISKEDLLSKTVTIIERFIRFINRALIGMVTGLNLVQGLILPSIDKAKNTTIQKLIGTLPVIGDGTEAVSNIVLGSINLIKNSLGVFAIVIVITFCLVPFIQMLLYSISLRVVSAIVQPVADKRILEGIENLCKGTGMLIRIIWSSSLLFIISIAIICMTTGGH
jgi:stage III sporulation protein AE